MGVETLLIAAAVGSVMQAGQQAKAGADREKEILREGSLRADRLRKETLSKASRQRASFFSSGLELEGTPLSVLDETVRVGQEDIDLTLDNAARSGKAARKAGRMAGLSTLATTASTFALSGGLGSIGGGAASSGAAASSSTGVGSAFGNFAQSGNAATSVQPMKLRSFSFGG